MDKIVLIENESQAKEYLKRIGEFREFTPITFDFKSEELLLNEGIEFNTEEDYETETIYKGIYDTSLSNTREICSKVNIHYRGINLFQLFYMDLFRFLMISRRYLRLLKKIKTIEKPIEVLTLKKDSFDIKEEICLELSKFIFETVIEVTYYEKISYHPLVWAGRLIQKITSSIALLSNKNKIFFDDSKVRFEPLIKELIKDNKLFRCNSSLQKSFFVEEKYIPFYEFTQKKTEHQEKLMSDINEFKQIDYKEIKLETELYSILEEWINYYIKNKFIEFSGIINHIISLIESNKINMIVLHSDSEPFGKTLAQVGRLYNIPSIVILHGLLGSEISAGYYPLSADYIVSFGKGSSERLTKLGIKKEKIIPLGSPQFDKYFTKRRKIVFITSCSNSHNALPEIGMSKKNIKKTCTMLYKALKKFPEYKLVVKGRKGWEMNNLPKLIAERENYDIEFVEDVNPVELLSDAEMVIVNVTTMAIDSLCLNKSVISIWFKNMEEKVKGYKYSDSIRVVYNQEELERAIRECKNSSEEKRKKYLESELESLDGKASERIASFINNLILEDKDD
jgi:hypothetical protein